MKNQTPTSELGIEELNNIVKATKQQIEDKQFEKRKEQIKKLNSKSLYQLSNNLTDKVWNDYEPYIFDFGYILERLNKEVYGDEDKNERTFEESLRIRVEISEQISQMKEVPAFDTECHIESRYLGRYTSIKSFICKKILGQRKYRLVFHNKKMDYREKCYKKQKRFSFSQKIVILELFIILLSIVLSNEVLLFMDILFILVLSAGTALAYIFDS